MTIFPIEYWNSCDINRNILIAERRDYLLNEWMIEGRYEIKDQLIREIYSNNLTDIENIYIKKSNTGQ